MQKERFEQSTLGHKIIKNTLIYTQLLPFKEEEQFICKVALNATEAIELAKDGFIYVKEEYNDSDKNKKSK